MPGISRTCENFKHSSLVAIRSSSRKGCSPFRRQLKLRYLEYPQGPYRRNLLKRDQVWDNDDIPALGQPFVVIATTCMCYANDLVYKTIIINSTQTRYTRKNLIAWKMHLLLSSFISIRALS